MFRNVVLSAAVALGGVSHGVVFRQSGPAAREAGGLLIPGGNASAASAASAAAAATASSQLILWQTAASNEQSLGGAPWILDVQTGCVPDLPGGPLTAGVAMCFCMCWFMVCIVACVENADRPRSVAKGLMMSAAPAAPQLPLTAAWGGGSVAAAAAAVAAQAPPPSLRSTRKAHINSLDGMRTLLVTYVILCHFPEGLPTWARAGFVEPGWTMQFFFVLSGFVAGYVTEGRTDYFDVSASLPFVARRLLRLLPMYYLALLIHYTSALCRGAPARPLIAWPVNALFLQGLLPVKVCGQPDAPWTSGFVHFNSNGVGWFLACIVWATCCFPALYNLRPRSGLLWTCLALAFVIVCRMLPELFSPTWSHWDSSGQGLSSGSLHLYAFAPLRLLEYAAGILTAHAVRQLPPAVRTRPHRAWGWAFDGLLLLGVAAVYFSLKRGSSATCSGEYFLTPLWCLVCAVARLSAEAGNVGPPTAGPLHGALAWGPLPALAAFSFPAYILQTAVLHIPRVQVGEGLFFPWNLVCIWAVAVLALRYVEEPVVAAADALLLRG